MGAKYTRNANQYKQKTGCPCAGTEPKLKAYLFARGENQAAAEKVLDELETLMNGYCKV